MMTAMKTTPALISFLTSDAIEGFREKAYDDLQPDLDLNPGDEHLVRGTITYGSGLIRRPDGTRLRLGDTITRQENFDRVQKYVRENVEPVIENLIHVPLWGSAYDAIGSIIYNFGAAEVSGWRLWGRINRGDPPADLAMEWLTGTWTSKGMPLLGLYRRRVMEVLMFFKLDWKPGANITWDDKVLNVLGSLGWDGTMPKPEVMPAPIPEPPSPKPEPAEPVILDEPLPPVPQPKKSPTPYREYDPASEPKDIAFSKRVWGFMTLIGGWIMLIPSMLANVPIVESVATLSPLQVTDWRWGAGAVMAGLWLQWFGKVKAKGPLK